MTRELDTFETTLLAELKNVVAEQPAAAPTLIPAPTSRRRSWWAIGAAAAAAVTVVASTATGLVGGSAAYAVTPQADGDIVVTVHELSDAKGLQQALEALGVTATVDYTVVQGGHVLVHQGGTLTGSDELPPGVTASSPSASQGSGTSVTDSESAGSGSVGPQGCGFTGDRAPIEVTSTSPDFVMTIPADSIARKTAIRLTTFDSTRGTAGLQASWTGTSGEDCGMVSVNSPG